MPPLSPMQQKLFPGQIPKLEVPNFLTLRQRVILSHVWALDELEKALLTQYTKVYCSVGDLMGSIDTDHEYKDFISWKRQKYELFYVNSSTAALEATENTAEEQLLLSIRANQNANFYVALVVRNPNPDQMRDDKPQYLISESNKVHNK